MTTLYGQAPPAARLLDEQALQGRIADVLTEWPSAGVAVAVVRDGQPTWFHAHGVADIATRTPVTQDTGFRIGSLTKAVTAVAIMQLWEQGRIDLDAPANDYLTTFTLTRTRPDLRPATVRHLLTHTSGIGYWRRLSDLLHPGVGAGIQTDRPLPLAEYYRNGLPQEVQPGTKWAYSNHGFAALGQIVEDVSGEPLATFYRGHIFDRLGMEHTDLTRSHRVLPGLATGYSAHRRGLRAVVHRECPAPGSGGLYSTVADVARFVEALLHPAETGVLQPSTVAMMFQPHFQPDSRVPGMGLGFDLLREGGVPVAGKGGTESGFLSQLALAPSEGLGVVVLTNTGGLSNQGAALPLAGALLRTLLGLPDDALRGDVAPHPEIWSELCGWYAPAPGPVTNLFTRALLGAGVEVVVEDKALHLKALTPVPAMRKGMRLHPDDPDDPYVFRVDFSDIGMGTMPVVFSGTSASTPGGTSGGTEQPASGGPATQFVMDLMDFHKRPEAWNPRRLATAAVAASAGTTLVLRRLHPSHRSRDERSTPCC